MFRNFNNSASIAAAASLVGGAAVLDSEYKVMPSLVKAQTTASFLGMNNMSRVFSSAGSSCNSA